jgi:hypothetical protein
MAALPGKFARFRGAGTAISGAFRWNIGFRRERLDTTNFESASNGVNVFSQGLTGVLDTTFQVEFYANDATINLFFPGVEGSADLLYRKAPALGYFGIACDVLSFGPSTEVRGIARYTVEFQSNGLVSAAAAA